MFGLEGHTAMQTPTGAQSGPECDKVTGLIDRAAEMGLQADPASIVNCYVALKSKPLAILIGPSESGKLALVQSLVSVLGGESLHCQILDGHAWWAGQTGNVGLFAEAQTRLIAGKILALIEEAWQPENAQRVLIACLMRISPDELRGFFSEVAFQLRHGQIMHLPCAHLTEPIPYPPNLLLIGTMDSARFDWTDKVLLSKTTIIDWPHTAPASIKCIPRRTGMLDGESMFLRSCIRDLISARRQVHRLLRGQRQALRPVLHVEQLLRHHGIYLPSSIRDEIAVYLANAWSLEGVGLFDRNNRMNTEVAYDFAMAQIILPHLAEIIQASPPLRGELRAALEPFPHAGAFMDNLDEIRPLKGGENPMVKDPVCGMDIDPKTAAGKSEYKGQTYYFCSPGCKKSFDKEPEKYVGKAHQPGEHHK